MGKQVVFPDTLEEQRKLFLDKQEYLGSRYEKMTPHAFYREVFPEGSLGPKGDWENRQGHGMAQIWYNKRKKDGTLLSGSKGFRLFRLIFDGLETIDSELPVSEKYSDPPAGKVRKSGTIYISPFSYFGKTAKEAMARQMFAFVIDLDKVTLAEIKAVEFHVSRGTRLPEPSLVVDSGTGLHLYYLLKEPEPMIPRNRQYFKEIKNWLVTACCTDGTTEKVVDVEHNAHGGDRLSLTQGYRAPGSQTKLGRDFLATGYKFSDRRYDLDDLFEFLPWAGVPDPPAVFFTKHEYDTTPLEKAKQLWPDWYERRIVNKEPKKTYTSPRGVYDWWLNLLRTSGNVREGIRYNCIFTLAVFAKKNNVPFEEMKADADSLLQRFDSLTQEDTNHFTQGDIDSAVKVYDTPEAKHYTRAYLEEKTWKFGTKNRRNGRTRSENLKRARAILELDYPNGSWQNKNGRPDKREIVAEWQAEHPEGRKADCIRDTGLSKHTVYKWWGCPVSHACETGQ